MSNRLREEKKEKYTLKTSGRIGDVQQLIDELVEKGHKSIKISGDLELQRALWFEAIMVGITVEGFVPSSQDKALLSELKRKKNVRAAQKMRASDVVKHYENQVIPTLQQQFDELRKNRRKEGITTTELDRAYGLNSVSGYRKDIDDRFYRTKKSLVRALGDLEDFRLLGHRSVEVRQSFEDGVSRLILSGESREAVGRNQVLSRQQKRY